MAIEDAGCRCTDYFWSLQRALLHQELEALAEVGWHRRRAARALGLTREGLRLLMQRLAIVPPNMRRRQRHGLT